MVCMCSVWKVSDQVLWCVYCICSVYAAAWGGTVIHLIYISQGQKIYDTLLGNWNVVKMPVYIKHKGIYRHLLKLFKTFLHLQFIYKSVFPTIPENWSAVHLICLFLNSYQLKNEKSFKKIWRVQLFNSVPIKTLFFFSLKWREIVVRFYLCVISSRWNITHSFLNIFCF